MVGEPNFVLLFIIFFGPSIYFLIKEIILKINGYKFCINKGILAGLIPGISFLMVVSDLKLLLTKPMKVYLSERNKDSCR
jgi:hypothetical protein